MVQNSANRLKELCRIIPPLLIAIPGEEFSRIPAPGKWSKKQIIGHLIDSASNNHQRFVRLQFEDTPSIGYEQNKWNRAGHYQSYNSSDLITFWTQYNLHLATLMTCIPGEFLQKKCVAGHEGLVTLEFLITDYVVHLEHHLRQVTQY